MYDVFVSYRHSDSEIVGRLVCELEKQGLVVWFDSASVADFGSISEAARAGLAESKAVVVFYSEGYPNSSPCQWELSQAFVAAMRLGDPRNRVLVVNPESESTHIEPVELRDAIYGTLAGNEPDQIEGVAAKIAAHVEAIGTTIGSGMAEPAMWLPTQPSAASCILRDLGELSHARVLGEEAVSISREVLGPRNDDTLVLMTNLVETLKACGDMSAARTLGEEVVTLSTDALGSDHRMTRAAIEALSSLGESAAP